MGFDLGYSDRSRFIFLLFFIFCKKQAIAMNVCKGRSSGVDPPVAWGKATGRGLIEGVNLSYTTRGVRPPAFAASAFFLR